MAVHERDREDLLRQATALVERAEVLLPGRSDSVVFGFRRDGSFSVFFGGDVVYQLNSAGELRRAFFDGLLYKADRGRLASLRRERSEQATLLVRRDLTEVDQVEFLARASAALRDLAQTLAESHYHLIGTAPPQSGVVARAISFLNGMPSSMRVANASNST